MGILNNFKNAFNNITSVARYKMITDKGNGFYAWNGKLYESDIVRACIRPRTKAIGKLIPKHIRNDAMGIKTNPEPYIRFLLEDPNPYMSGQMLQEKVTSQLALNNNAFILIIKDDNGYPVELYPIPCMTAEAIYNQTGDLFLKFYFQNGKTATFPYTEVIHLRDDYNSNDIFGEPPGLALTSLMNVVSIIDQGTIKAIKNSGIIRWLLQYNTSLRPEDLKKNVKEFTDNYLSVETETFGAAGTDAKATATRIEPKDFVPNAAQTDRTTERIYSFFNTNKKIVQSSYNEDEWISYYEARIEPDAMQMASEYTRKLFTRRERGFGNKIVFESSSLTFASMATKLGLSSFVELGIFNPNEVREIMNYAPRDGGDEYVRRLDTRPTSEPKNKANAFRNKSNSKKSKVYAVDFDGTLCNNLYPKIGWEKTNVTAYVKKLKEDGNRIILWTCRADDLLQEAVDWCAEKGIEFDGINENLEDIISEYGSDTRKISADIYLDDKALNVDDI